jgi:putative addiction module component (TIGR02574 family)
MSNRPKENPVRALEVEVLKLADKERAELARVLLLSLDEAEDQDTEREWAEEAERRYQELKAGRVQAIPSQQVFEEARARLRISFDLS